MLAFFVDEEPEVCAAYGTCSLLEGGPLTGDAAIIGEPGDQRIAIGHRGLYRFQLRIERQETHTGMRAWEQGQYGRNAMLDLARLTWRWRPPRCQPLPRRPFLAADRS